MSEPTATLFLGRAPTPSILTFTRRLAEYLRTRPGFGALEVPSRVVLRAREPYTSCSSLERARARLGELSLTYTLAQTWQANPSDAHEVAREETLTLEGYGGLSLTHDAGAEVVAISGAEVRAFLLDYYARDAMCGAPEVAAGLALSGRSISVSWRDARAALALGDLETAAAILARVGAARPAHRAFEEMRARLRAATA